MRRLPASQPLPLYRHVLGHSWAVETPRCFSSKLKKGPEQHRYLWARQGSNLRPLVCKAGIHRGMVSHHVSFVQFRGHSVSPGVSAVTPYYGTPWDTGGTASGAPVDNPANSLTEGATTHNCWDVE